MIGLTILFLFKNPAYQMQVYSLLIISIAFSIILDKVTDSISLKPLRCLLDNKLLLYIGKISYGLYLFHNLIPYYQLPFFSRSIGLNFIASQFMRFLILLSIASISWFLFEKPILKLKNNFVQDDI